MKNVIKNIFPSMNNIIDVFKNKRSVPRGLLERYSFDTVALNSPDESLKKNETILTQPKILIGRITTVAGVFCARLWEVVRAFCQFLK